MRAAVVLMCVSGFVAASTWSAIHFKFAADASGKRAIWHFIVGNIIGAFGPLALTFALKQTSPSLAYALCYGCAFALLQIVCWRLFQQALSMWQWTGIVLVGIGIFLLQVRGGQGS
jgi:multidrug transporter EmrE-like cation transporter